jgi:NAD(P)-dependent dehydrogenase (short-subunit alcohol dehydrogenase family)
MTGPSKRALVTGAGSGIGAACAEVMEQRGWHVIRTDQKPSHGIRPLDVTDESAWDGLMADLGPIDGLVTSAGIRTRNMIVDTTLDQWQRHLDVNLTGTWLAIRAFLRAVTQEGTADREPAAGTDSAAHQESSPPATTRAIVTIASVNATIAVPGQAHYVATKGAVASLTRAAAVEGAGLGVRVNAIAPGPIRTPMAEERLREPAQLAWLTGRVPLGRIGEPTEIGELAEFLLSERASYISGEVVYADGGWAANAV